MYIDFNHYLNNGGNHDMPRAAFDRSEFRARKLVDKMTQGRLKDMDEVPVAVKCLMVELISLEMTQGGAEIIKNQPVTSFSNDGYSETYADPLTSERVKEIEYKLIYEYLSGETDDHGTPLLYLGVD